MPSARSRLGAQGESVAAAHLRSRGMEVIDANYRTRYGEIDLIARDGETVVFLEVRTRRGGAYGLPEESVTPRKRERLARVAQGYLQAHGLESADWRIDVVAIVLQPDGPAAINHVEGIEV